MATLSPTKVQFLGEAANGSCGFLRLSAFPLGQNGVRQG